MIIKIFVVLLVLVESLTTNQCGAPYWEILPLDSLPSSELMDTPFSNILTPFSFNIKNKQYNQQYTVTQITLFSKAQSPKRPFSKIKDGYWQITQQISIWLQTDLIVFFIQQQQRLQTRCFILYKTANISHSKTIKDTVDGKLRFAFGNKKQFAFVIDKLEFDIDISQGLYSRVQSMIQQQITPQIQNYYFQNIDKLLQTTISKQNYSSFASSISKLTNQNASIMAKTQITQFLFLQSAVLMYFNMSDPSQSSALCSSQKPESTIPGSYLTSQLINYYFHNLIEKSSYFLPMTFTKFNSSVYFQMFLVSLQDVIPSSINISHQYDSQINVVCEPLFRSDYHQLLMNLSFSQNPHVSVQWSCHVDHPLTGTNIINFVAEIEYKVSWKKLQKMFKLNVWKNSLSKLVWMQTGFALVQKKLGQIFVQSYLSMTPRSVDVYYESPFQKYSFLFSGTD